MAAKKKTRSKARTARLVQLLNAFCADGPYLRYDLTKPFIKGGYTYATDGRICIRVRGTVGCFRRKWSRFKHPNVSDLPWALTARGKSSDLPGWMKDDRANLRHKDARLGTLFAPVEVGGKMFCGFYAMLVHAVSHSMRIYTNKKNGRFLGHFRDGDVEGLLMGCGLGTRRLIPGQRVELMQALYTN